MINNILGNLNNTLTVILSIISILATIFSGREIYAEYKEGKKNKRRKYIILGVISALLFLICIYANTLVKVPKVEGEFYVDARRILNDCGLNYNKVKESENSIVLTQSSKDIYVIKGSTIELVMENQVIVNEIGNEKHNFNISFEEILFEYYESPDEIHSIKKSYYLDSENVENILIVDSSNKTNEHDWKIEDGLLVIKDIPLGEYSVSIKLIGKAQINSTIEFNKESNMETVQLKNEQSKQFKIRIVNNDNGIPDVNCRINIEDGTELIDELVSNDSGFIPHSFISYGQSGSIEIYEETGVIKEENFYFEDIKARDRIEIQIDKDVDANGDNIANNNQSGKKINVTEAHDPNDAATSVSLINWDENKDIGIDGRKYGGGIKVSISNMFSSMGSSVENKVISRITIPVPRTEVEDNYYGVFILDQEMFGSNSHAVIRIIINNEELYNSGVIDGNSKEPLNFDVPFSNTDTIIVETEAVLKGGDFVFGMVSPTE